MNTNSLPAMLLGVALVATGCRQDAVQADPARSSATGAGELLDADAEAPDAKEARCPSGAPGPEMALISTASAKHYCIDRTEVTQAQYQKFVTAAGKDLSLIASIPECSWQKTFEVTVRPEDNPSLYGCPKGEYDPVAKPDQPAGCISWCMAFAYCRWAGKRLCGRIGGGALSDRIADRNDAQQSQWFYTCTQGGKSAYQYGDSYQATCSPAALEPVTKVSTGCTGQQPPYSEISGMSSGVSEWEDACAGEDCNLRGGTFVNLPAGGQVFRCDDSSCAVRGWMTPGVGFRCCADVD
jgi:sulfatase modifying factor 1